MIYLTFVLYFVKIFNWFITMWHCRSKTKRDNHYILKRRKYFDSNDYVKKILTVVYQGYFIQTEHAPTIFIYYKLVWIYTRLNVHWWIMNRGEGLSLLHFPLNGIFNFYLRNVFSFFLLLVGYANFYKNVLNSTLKNRVTIYSYKSSNYSTQSARSIMFIKIYAKLNSMYGIHLHTIWVRCTFEYNYIFTSELICIVSSKLIRVRYFQSLRCTFSLILNRYMR